MEKLRSIVTYIVTGEVFAVPAFTYRPSHSARVGATLHGRGTRIGSGGFVPCAGCGRFVAVGDDSVTVNGIAVVVAALSCDRAVNDLPNFTVTRPVAYHPSTCIPTCPTCNGSARRALWIPQLESAALERLREYAPCRTL